MAPDLVALTGSVVLGLPDIQACLLLSEDGLPIAAFPPEHESRAAEWWARLSEVGEVRRGFLVVGDELWAVSRRERYTALGLGSASARPALILDRLDRMLAAAVAEPVSPAAEEPPPRPAASQRLLLAAHPEEEPETQAPFPVSIATVWPTPDDGADADQAQEATDGTAGDGGGADEEPEPVDALALTREFAGLLAEGEAG